MTELHAGQRWQRRRTTLMPLVTGRPRALRRRKPAQVPFFAATGTHQITGLHCAGTTR